MQRYHATSCTSSVNNSAIGGTSARDASRTDSSSLSSNLPVNSRRPNLLTPYKLKCDKEPLNSRLGPPDFHPQTPNCPEETLTREYVQNGYKETVEGLEEGREIPPSQVQTFSKPVVLKCREAIRKCLRAINESRAQKRKAGQVYGVPLTGSLLSKPGAYPELRQCGEDFKKKWIEGLSQQHKRLCSLADHVPIGYRKRSLFEVLVRNNVPLLRATWFVKVTYLNQVRPSSANISSGAADKSQLSRTELWTKDVIDYMQYLLDEFISRNNSHSTQHTRDRSPQVLYAGSVLQRSDPAAVVDGEEPSLHFKWWYVVRLVQWHHAEGLLLPSHIIDWVLNQLKFQEKELLEILQLVLPIIYGVLETIVLSQTYVRSLVGVAIHLIREPSPGGSDLVDNSRRAYTMSALAEMLRYLILAVPDTFVALDCFPLPPCVVSYAASDGNFMSKASEDAGKIKNSSTDVACVFRWKGVDAQYQSFSFDHVISAIQRHADNLVKGASPGYPGHNVAKAVQALDKALLHGDVRGAYKYLFGDLRDGAVDECWIAEVSPCLRSSLKWIGAVSLSFVCSVFFLCEWATCDFRDFRNAPLHDVKFTGGKDFSQIYVAIRLLKLKVRDLHTLPRRKSESVAKVSNQQNSYSGRKFLGSGYEIKNAKHVDGMRIQSSDIFESPGPLHDIIVCWIDQHKVHKGEGVKRLQHFICELVQSGIFYPQAYVRQLIVSGILEKNGPMVDLDRRRRHHRILKQLPGLLLRDALEEARIAEGSHLSDTMNVYSNERRVVLRELLGGQYDNVNVFSQKLKSNQTHGRHSVAPARADQWKTFQSCSSKSPGKNVKSDADIEELKASISVLLQLPTSLSTSVDTGLDESQGSVKRSLVTTGNKIDPSEGTPGCEDCKRAKKQKVSEERSSFLQIPSPTQSDDEDMWWVRKGPKPIESFKVDPPLKSTKQVSRSRQKTVRRTQSLAQLQAARIEGSQGASTSHVCDSKVICPHHRTELEGETLKSMDRVRNTCCGDIVSIGKALKKLRFVEKRTVTFWLLSVVRQLVEDSEKSVAKVGQLRRSYVPVDDRSVLRWRLGEDELSALLYFMDACNDLVSAAKFLLWLLPKVLSSSSSTIHSVRNIQMLARNVENHVCEVGEAFLLSSIRRYENVLVATDLIPEALSATMHRAAAVMTSNGRVSGSAAYGYARYLLKKYNNVASVIEWEKNFKSTCDKRLLSELESGRSLDGEFGFPLGVPPGVEDLDDYFRQKISVGRVSRVGLSMRDVVQQHMDDAFHYFLEKERKHLAAGSPKGPAIEKSDEEFQFAKQIIIGLMDCIRQTGGAAQEGDPSLVSSAVSAIVINVGPIMAKMHDFAVGSNYQNYPSSTVSLNFARRILRIHIACLCLLKEALGERQSRVFEIALATEASCALAGVFSPGKASRGQFQMSPEAHDSTPSMPNDIINNSSKVALGKAAKTVAAISSLIIGAVLHGVTSLERMVTVFRLKEGLDVIQFVRSMKSTSNGNTRTIGAFKDNSTEVYVHWFRLLVGNCRTVCDGLVVDLLGEPSIVALSRMQRMLPLSLVFPPAFSIFAFVRWKAFIVNGNLANREDIHQLYQSLTLAIGDAIRHLPFRDVLLRDSQSFYDLVAADSTDAEFAAILELNGLDMHLKSKAFVPLRVRLFLNAVIDCKMPCFVYKQDDMNWVSGHGDSQGHYVEHETKLLDKLVNVLDALQPAKFHWQWVELRLLLDEQALIEKVENHDMPLADAIRSLSPSPEKVVASENESNFIEIILTRLLVRPDAAPLFSELVHLFGRSLEDSMLLQAKWFLGGHDVLFGRKTIRQRLINIAESKGLSTKAQFCKPWGWSNSGCDPSLNRGEKKLEVPSLEEGEVVEEGVDSKRYGRGLTQTLDLEGIITSQQHVTERAFIELVLPCIDQSSDDSRNTFASELIKQLNNIEQQINTVTRGASKLAGSTPGIEGPTNRGNNRKTIRGGSPGLVRRAAGTADSAPPSPGGLRASMSLRLQFLLRLLPIIYADGEPSGRNMRHMLASVILRLLGSRVVHEDADLSFYPKQSFQSKREMESPPENFSFPSMDLSGESLFDRLLLVLHGLLSSCQPSWLRSKPASKSSNLSKDSFGFDREMVESLQNDLDRMQLPDTIRWRIQAAMPILLPLVRCSSSCQPPSAPISALASLQPSISISGVYPGNLSTSQRNPVPLARTAANSGKSKTLPLQQDNDMEVDPWMLLEDGAGSITSSSNTAVIGNGDHANLRAASWLKGAIRVRRSDLTYIGAVDDDS
ncbi:mediator of RNA polymerase II transcription subunit 12-like [Mangifera indica]|uniref:mediator of RNA polymerase II transcription subunit 12-like n=1 Tax=Mangifera indica TaxID=29780 RepID=UPI001CF9A5CB|nr:mediator of RNA polymerase II transcription subunit 12-like [Mangifera indica]XP_044492153.1 mediator of RNA polymerase II transcription subunit 12-like [Mangifera indica]XP_044492154.1 mediator of RNA polymerase II transcription subunit 12-like [Mangifera indica]XP_044492155.1 mediator of RNA polymerase II transcription subunit 12-like [Mangifera indica]XP_044492156.1 mediator of RNA polymerase II transcription subunit 12-like [Mangifera indica]